jgi:hypothetical protein
MKMNTPDLLKYVGNLTQLGGCRHYTLTDGWARGLRAIDINTGGGLQYTVLPDRAMDISLAAYKGSNLVYLTYNGETSPYYYEPEGIGWLRTFNGGLLTTCGLTYLGSPCTDGGESLGLHGRVSTTPAKQLADDSGWTGEDYLLKVSGIIEEGYLFGNKLRMKREISSVLGRNEIHLKDTITNSGNKTSPLTILYHMNFGYPFLSENTELIIDPAETLARDSDASAGLSEFRSFIGPQAAYNEQVFFHTMKGNESGETGVEIINRKLRTAVAIKFNIKSLPFVSQWKMMASGEYVLGIEPGNVHSKSRTTLRDEYRLPVLEPGESAFFELDIMVRDI